jgi:hypothetical protein
MNFCKIKLVSFSSNFLICNMKFGLRFGCWQLVFPYLLLMRNTGTVQYRFVSESFSALIPCLPKSPISTIKRKQK